MVNRRVVTADDVLRLASHGATELVVAPGDRLTPLARDLVRERGVRLVERGPAVAQSSAPQSSGSGRALPPLRHIAAVDRIDLPTFPVDLGRPEMDVRARDVVTAADGMAMAAGVLSLREGSFPWTLQYDEVQYVLEGELHITRGGDLVVGRPGDIIAVPKGSSITFGTPSWARFLYVTYPADWEGAS